MRTKNTNDTKEQNLINGAFGLIGETGEVIDQLKKHIFHKHPLDESEIIEELGDVLWYITLIADTLGYNIADVAFRNIFKLEKRYTEGFTSEASINREV